MEISTAFEKNQSRGANKHWDKGKSTQLSGRPSESLKSLSSEWNPRALCKVELISGFVACISQSTALCIAVVGHQLMTSSSYITSFTAPLMFSMNVDYTGKYVTAKNQYAALRGDKKAVKGGNGKDVNSKANDRIFLYYYDHGGPGVLEMLSMPYLHATGLIGVLKKKHAAKGYKEMVIYVEACESGSIFEGVIPKDLDVYVMTASNVLENSFETYCPGMNHSPPLEYITCLGDLYSVAWIEDMHTILFFETNLCHVRNTI